MRCDHFIYKVFARGQRARVANLVPIVEAYQTSTLTYNRADIDVLDTVLTVLTRADTYSA